MPWPRGVESMETSSIAMSYAAAMSQSSVPLPPPPPAAPSLEQTVAEMAKVQEQALAARVQASAAAKAAGRSAVSSIEQMNGLRARRELLNDQLSQATDQREELVRQLEQAPAGAREGIQQRITQLDQRILQLDRDVAQAGNDLAAAPPELLAQTEQRPREVIHTGPDEGEVVAIVFSSFGFGILLTLIVGRMRAWRRRRRGGGEPATAVRIDDPRIDRLAHALDAVAVEVERIGEGQRFVTQLLAESRSRGALAASERATVDPAVR